jgi:hypothetical protein
VSTNDGRDVTVAFGLGLVEPDSLRVRWPSGNATVVAYPGVDTLLVISESQSGTGVSVVPPAPERFALHAPVPNPFNPVTSIRFDVAARGRVRMVVYDVTGRRVRVLTDGVRPPGTFVVRWDGRDAFDRPAASGVYFVRMEAGGFVGTSKLALLR